MKPLYATSSQRFNPQRSRREIYRLPLHSQILAAAGKKNGAKAGVMSEPKPTDKKPADRLVLPKGWSLKQAHAAVVLRDHLGAESEAFGAYCRALGVQTTQVARLASWFASHELTDLQARMEAENSLHQEQIRIKQLMHELQRKDKALAETARPVECE